VQAILDSDVLVLNRLYQPVHVTTVRRAFVQLYEGAAKAVDAQYRTFDFASWSELSDAVRNAEVETIGTLRRRLLVPRVILVTGYALMPRTAVRFSRANIYARDASRCQYCRRRLPRGELNLDHVVPRSRGGATNWENIVCSCIRCNMRKADRTPEEAGMRLARKPARPRWTPLFRAPLRFFEEWRPYLTVADMAYWTVELENDGTGAVTDRAVTDR
jgi:5-methylcytosine-specific restriction endonuclease McrA